MATFKVAMKRIILCGLFFIGSFAGNFAAKPKQPEQPTVSDKNDITCRWMVFKGQYVQYPMEITLDTGENINSKHNYTK